MKTATYNETLKKKPIAMNHEIENSTDNEINDLRVDIFHIIALEKIGKIRTTLQIIISLSQ